MSIFRFFSKKLDNSTSSLLESYKILAKRMGCGEKPSDVEILIMKKFMEFNLTKEQLQKEIYKLEPQKKKESKKYGRIPEYTPAGIMQTAMKNYLQDFIIDRDEFIKDFFEY